MGKDRSNKQEINITGSNQVNIGDLAMNVNHAQAKGESRGLAQLTGHKKQELRKLVADGAIEQCLTVLGQWLENSDDRYDSVLLLLGRHSRMKAMQRAGTVSEEEVRQESNKITRATLELIANME